METYTQSLPKYRSIKCTKCGKNTIHERDLNASILGKFYDCLLCGTTVELE